MNEQITHAFLDWIAAECAVHPVVLVLEDLQWGDALTIKLLHSALRDGGEVALFVLSLGRPEAKDALPSLPSELSQEIALRPLSRKASERLVKGALEDAVDPETLANIVKLAEGNALYLEELIRAAAEGKAGDVPETVLAMLQARLSRLPPEVRRALRAGSVFGESFWPGAVRAACESWGATADVAPRLAQLVEAEIVERRRESRFPSELEYGFRHALVRDAAYRLLTEADRRAGHLAAGRWLEAMGEADAMALAGHAREGGDMARAVAFYTSAAVKSMERDDLGEALARATQGIECGAEGQALGVLQAIQSVALYGLPDWPRCGAIGLAAVERLPRGSEWWCRAVEKLFQVLPQLDQLDRFDGLIREGIEQVEPTPEAGAFYVRALSGLMTGFAMVGARDRGLRCVELIERVGSAIFERDPYVRGIANVWCGFFFYLLEPDAGRALSLIGQSVRDFEESQVIHSLCMALVLEGAVRMLLGDSVRGEELTRRGLSVAEEAREGYPIANARYFLGLAIAERAEPDKLDEAERLADAVIAAKVGPSYDGCARMVLSLIAVLKGDFERAEAEALSARGFFRTLPPLWLRATASLIDALVAQGRLADAVAAAREGSAVLDRLGSAGFGELHFRLAAAGALFQAGEREEAESTLCEAVRQLQLRAAKIPDAALRETFLHKNRFHARVLELARERLGPS